MATSATLDGFYDNRNAEKNIKPVWNAQATFVWQTGDGHAAQQVDVPFINGTIKQVVVNASSVTDNPTLTVSLQGDQSETLYSVGSLADGTVHCKKPGDTGFGDIVVCEDALSIIVDPSADPGGTSQTLTVVVVIKGI
jgi:hypothetical protein